MARVDMFWQVNVVNGVHSLWRLRTIFHTGQNRLWQGERVMSNELTYKIHNWADCCPQEFIKSSDTSTDCHFWLSLINKRCLTGARQGNEQQPYSQTLVAGNGTVWSAYTMSTFCLRTVSLNSSGWEYRQANPKLVNDNWHDV